MRQNRFLWAAWLAAAGLLWLFENSAATLTLLIASALLPALSILAAKRAAGRIRLSLAAARGSAKGGALHATLSVDNIGVFSRVAGRAACENRLTGERAETAFSFSPRLSGQAAATLAADTARCGTLRLDAEAWTEDLFGLWRSDGVECGTAFVTVEPKLFLPAVALAENTTVVSAGEQYSQTRAGSDPSETFAIREYRPGDPIRQIHWKLSQKTETMMLRELGLPIVNQTLLVYRNLLVAGETVPPRDADAMAEVFLSISRALAGEGLAHIAAFAEDGRFMLTEVQNDVDFRAMEARFLTLSWEADDGALARLLVETPSAHVAVVSAAAPPDAETFCRGNRVTLLTPA
ncbi:MAG: DUF58 domain-containing protein [Oscillospiraceae bacterium]|nr:DUF58 domain-containing protein [Oscillospiraceae bacterium]